ncbi:hypothetical protein LCGC14_2620650 [marine sediment metagenome]|uniref:Uncharacterized protein n=1 Tax=marine sediment metagenome TaxID=412755 RepID=A0A0F9CVQ1_9ZZZZ
MGNQEHYTGSKYHKGALGLIDKLIGYETAKNDILALELLKDLRAIIELHWGK